MRSDIKLALLSWHCHRASFIKLALSFQVPKLARCFQSSPIPLHVLYYLCIYTSESEDKLIGITICLTWQDHIDEIAVGFMCVIRLDIICLCH